ncbi:MAG: hypothetical protein KBB39_02835 [Phycicoccus sp.]|nr:hypothetical protein [Phycicoccus sp.]
MDTGELDRLVTTNSWEPLNALLRSLTDEETAAAAAWYRRGGRALARQEAELGWQDEPRVVQLLLALTLARTAREASQNCRWGFRGLRNIEESAVAACADALIGRGREWAAEFVQLATAKTFRGEAGRAAAPEIVALTSAAIDAYALEVPATDTFVRGWASLVSVAQRYTQLTDKAVWQPLTLMTAGPGPARAAYQQGDDLTLSDCLGATTSVTAVLTAALEVPNGLATWADFTQDGWRVDLAIRDGVRSGSLDREPLLDSAFRALSRDDKAFNQRVIETILGGLDPQPAEVRERAALILHVLPVVHGSVTRALLDLVLASGVDDDILLEIGAIILARPEKAQKTTLLTHLATSTSAVREALLQLAAESPDATLAAKARALLGTSEDSDSSDQGAYGLPRWAQVVEPRVTAPFEPYAASAAGIDQAQSDEDIWSRITTEAAYLDLVVRLGHDNLALLRSRVSNAPTPTWYTAGRTAFLVHQWVTTGESHRSYRLSWTVHTHTAGGDGPVVEERTSEHLPAGHSLFSDHLIEETLERVGTVRELLSTPSHADGTLDVGTLVERVRQARSVGYGEYDLVQALLRLAPTRPEDTRLFDGLRLAPAGGSGHGGRVRSWLSSRKPAGEGLDGVEVIRGWIAGGGWPERDVDFPGVEPRTSPVSLPLPAALAALDGVAAVSRPAGADDEIPKWGQDEPGPRLGVCPHDVEQLAALIAQRDDHDSVVHAHKLPLIVHAAGPIGAAVHHHLARQLAHPRLDCRLLTAQAAAELARQGRLDPAVLRERSLALHAAGRLSLARAVHGWSQLAEQASLEVVWPTWVAVLDAACSAAKKPAGLADLLRVTREYAPGVRGHVPDGWLPESVRALAAARGSSKAAVEARALVESLSVVGQSQR